jgi:hypothetical protein
LALRIQVRHRARLRKLIRRWREVARDVGRHFPDAALSRTGFEAMRLKVCKATEL